MVKKNTKEEIEDDDFDEEMDDLLYSDGDTWEKSSRDVMEEGETVEEVFAFQDSDSVESDENEKTGGDEFSDLPDTRAWGKKRKTYYSTDYVDKDFSTLNEKDEKNAEIEEEEAKNIQKRLAQELDDVDFGFNVILDNETESKSNDGDIIKVDVSKFTSRQKLELFEKESPEFMTLVNDLKDKMTEIKTILGPFLKIIKEEDISVDLVTTFVQIKYQLILNYCINILLYLTLKAKRLFVNTHPVIKRLSQYRQLLNQLELSQGKIYECLKKVLQIYENQNNIPRIKFRDSSAANWRKTNRTECDENVEIQEIKESEGSLNDINNQGDENWQVDRREITYKISKNKGLTPHRSKEQRNPRVKHRKKYRKALIRRKGAVREVRKELGRYGGEISGIKVGVKRSILLK